MADDESLREMLARLEEKIDSLAQAHPHTGVLKGGKAIAAYLNVHIRTVRRWAAKYRLPVAHLPDGRLVCTASLVDQWILDCRERQYAQPLGRGRKCYPQK